MGAWRSDPAVRQEALLVDHVTRLERYRQGRRVVHFRLSLLRPYNLRDHHMRIALTMVDELVRRYDGHLYRLASGDLVLLTKGAGCAEIEEVAARLRLFFGADPMFDSAETAGAFVAWYDLDVDYEACLAAIQSLALSAAERPSAAAPAPGGRDTAALDLIRLEQVRRVMTSADLSPFLRRQAVFRTSGSALEPAFHELYVSIADLERAFLPGSSLASDRWLFQHMTRVLDLRVLSLIGARRCASVADISLNLNIATVLSPEFLAFDREVPKPERGSITIELQPIDIMADISSFMCARDFLRERGYRLCVDGVKHLALPLVDCDWLGVDFVKLHWGPDLLDDLDGRRGEGLKAAARRIGAERLILARCDSPDAVRAGAALEITLYQGRLFDAAKSAPACDKDGIAAPTASS